uniref:Uncharacterized protein n=1 Tax=Romanomermis culicivorax TaxID=13658 RepID=A0A915JPK6_ROMCU
MTFFRQSSGKSIKVTFFSLANSKSYRVDDCSRHSRLKSSLSVLEQMKVPLPSGFRRDDLLNVAKTSIRTKLRADLADHLAE